MMFLLGELLPEESDLNIRFMTSPVLLILGMMCLVIRQHVNQHCEHAWVAARRM